MPALNPVPKVIRADLFLSVGANTRVRDRFFLQYTGAGPSVADLTTVAGTMSTAWLNNMVAQVNTGVTLTGITLTDLTSAAAAQTVTTQARVGTLAGTPLSAGVAMLVKFKIARRYRGGHPRIYIPGRVIADVNTSTTWVAGSVTGLVTAWAAFIAASIAGPPASIGTLVHVNVSYFTSFTNRTNTSGRTFPRPNPRANPLIDAVTAYSGNIQIASQRRRNQQSP